MYGVCSNCRTIAVDPKLSRPCTVLNKVCFSVHTIILSWVFWDVSLKTNPMEGTLGIRPAFYLRKWMAHFHLPHSGRQFTSLWNVWWVVVICIDLHCGLLNEARLAGRGSTGSPMAPELFGSPCPFPQRINWLVERWCASSPMAWKLWVVCSPSHCQLGNWWRKGA